MEVAVSRFDNQKPQIEQKNDRTSRNVLGGFECGRLVLKAAGRAIENKGFPEMRWTIFKLIDVAPDSGVQGRWKRIFVSS